MPKNSKSHFILVVGDDDFLVDREAKARFAEMCEGTEEESREIVDGMATKVSEVENAMSAFLSATRTVSLFGGKKVVWFRNLNWLADGVIRVKPADESKEGAKGKKSKKKDLFEDAADKIAGEFSASDPAVLNVVISVVKPDKRRTAVKKLLAVGELVSVASADDPDALVEMIEQRARELDVSFDDDAARLLAGKVNGNMRMIFSEIEKLACFAGKGGSIDADTVMRLVPVFGAGDFFEPVEYFFSLDLAGTLASLRRFFFNNTSARPLIAAMQNRNRLLIQMRALIDSGEASIGFRGGISKSALESAKVRYASLFSGNAEKSSLNLFSQNTWYVGEKLAGTTLKNKSVTLKRLIDWQLDFVHAFETLIDRPGDDEAVMRELTVRCLGK